MQVTDPIADLLTRVRNAQQAGKEIIEVPASKMKIAITHILREQGFIRDYKCIRDNKQGKIKLALRYDEEGNPAIREIARISKSSKRVYIAVDKLPYVKNGFGVAIISTSKGVMTDSEARKLGVGGEHICSVF
jgi:small subunit ribosomal protein S8